MLCGPGFTYLIIQISADKAEMSQSVRKSETEGVEKPLSIELYEPGRSSIVPYSQVLIVSLPLFLQSFLLPDSKVYSNIFKN